MVGFGFFLISLCGSYVAKVVAVEAGSRTPTDQEGAEVWERPVRSEKGFLLKLTGKGPFSMIVPSEKPIN